MPLFELLSSAAPRVAVTALLLIAVRALLGRLLGPKARYYLWCILLLHMLFVPLPSSPVSLFAALPDAPAAEQVIGTAAGSLSSLSGGASPALSGGAADSSALSAAPEKVYAGTAGGTGTLYVTPSAALPLPELLSVLYLAGAAALTLILLIRSLLFLRSARRMPRCTDPRVLRIFDRAAARAGVSPRRFILRESRSVQMTGIFRPCIFIDPSYSDDALEAALVHELMHAKYLDLPLSLLFTGACILHWFHPLVWICRYLMRRDCEFCCDARVLERSIGRRTYAETVLQAATAPQDGCAVSTSFAGHETKRRIHQIARFRRRGVLLTVLALLLLAAVLCLVLPKADGPAEPPETPITDSDTLNSFYQEYIYDAIYSIGNEPFAPGEEPAREAALHYTFVTLLRSGDSDGTTAEGYVWLEPETVRRAYYQYFNQDIAVDPAVDYVTSNFFVPGSALSAPDDTAIPGGFSADYLSVPGRYDELSPWCSKMVSLSYCEELSRYRAVLEAYTDTTCSVVSVRYIFTLIEREDGTCYFESVSYEPEVLPLPEPLTGSITELARTTALTAAPDALVPFSPLLCEEDRIFYGGHAASGESALSVIDAATLRPIANIALPIPGAYPYALRRAENGYFLLTSSGVIVFTPELEVQNVYMLSRLSGGAEISGVQYDLCAARIEEAPSLLYVQDRLLMYNNSADGSTRTLYTLPDELPAHFADVPGEYRFSTALAYPRLVDGGRKAYCEILGYESVIGSIVVDIESGRTEQYFYHSYSDTSLLDTGCGGFFHIAQDGRHAFSLHAAPDTASGRMRLILESLNFSDMTLTAAVLPDSLSFDSLVQDNSGAVLALNDQSMICALSCTADGRPARRFVRIDLAAFPDGEADILTELASFVEDGPLPDFLFVTPKQELAACFLLGGEYAFARIGA